MSRRRTAPHFGRLAPPHLAARTLRLLVRLGTTLLLGVAILAARTTAASPIPLQETASNAGSSISGGEKGNESSLPPEVIDALIAEMRSLIAVEMEQKGIPSFSIALVDGDRIVWAEGFGTARTEGNVPVAADTIYRVGSISKLLTDLQVMREVEAGRIDLDAEVSTYLPEFAPRNPFDAPITLRRLMSHRSGLVRESPVGNYFDPDEPSLEATVASLNATSIVYPPGTRTKYSNAAIAVVGRVLEQVSGETFESLLDRELFAPLGMTSSFWRPRDDLRNRTAEGWMWSHDGQRFVAPEFVLGTLPAGNLYASVEDLGRFLIAVGDRGEIDGNRVLSSELLETMLQPIDPNDSRAFGIGFHLSDFHGVRSYGHGGAVYGFATQIRGLPDERLAVAAVAGLDGANGIVTRLSDHALHRMLAAKRGEPKPEYELTGPVSIDRARMLEGAFADESGATIELDERGGRLTIREGSLLSELRQLGDLLQVDDVFSWGPALEVVSVDELRWRGKTWRRLDDLPPPPAPDRWAGLIGEYGWDHNTLYILEERGRLIALIEWFYWYPLEELGPNEFAFPDYGLYHGEKLIFEPGSDGRAERVTAAEVTFERRRLTDDGATFRIDPLRPVAELRAEAATASPPEERGEFREQELTELTELDRSIRLDVRYATSNNFMGVPFYTQGRAFLQRPAAEALVRVHERAEAYGVGLTIHDAYRPWSVTKMFFEGTPDELKRFVADPSRGSRHNRGCAVDLTLHDRATGEVIPMVAGYDEFSTRSYPDYPGGTSRARWYRSLLRRLMEAEGFTVYEYEWWHFDYADWQQYRLQNVPFESLGE